MTKPDARLEFRFADGLRGIAALGVALFHTYAFTGTTTSPDQLPIFFKIMALGNYAVPVFIVLSGFVLMLPVARTLRLKHGTWTFIKRRARRILPPYYAAIALFLLLIAFTPMLHEPHGTAWDSKIPVTLAGVVSHVFLVHNVNPEWIYLIDGPAWSVATEWQIYFALPFMLLPFWRRFGGAVTVTTAVAIGASVHYALPWLDDAHFWFIGLFAMGMWAAHAVVHMTPLPRPGLVIASMLIIAGGAAVAPWSLTWVAESAVGAACAIVLVLLARQSLAGRPGHLRGVLESWPLLGIGKWSYSLYLVHSPILALGNLLLLPIHLPVLVHFAVMTFAVLPAACAVSYGFYLIVERHFLTSHQKSTTASAHKLQENRQREADRK